MDSDEASIEQKQQLQRSRKVVHLQKQPNKTWGFTIRQEEEGSSIVVGRVVAGEAAAQAGSLREGDELLSVNGASLVGKSVGDVGHMLGSAVDQLTIEIHPVGRSRASSVGNSNLTVRALFSYMPRLDEFSPCKDLGLTFHRGDIIHVISQDNPEYWQGWKDSEDEANDMARILPSPERLKLLNSMAPERGPYYERQVRLPPQPPRPRPLVLVGLPGVGHQELQYLLVMSNLSQFQFAVPHTTRQPKEKEENGVDYWFIDEAQFRQQQSNGDFIETSQCHGDFYGTSVASVQQVVNEGKVCVLTLQPESLEVLRCHPARLMPYAVFVMPPNREELLDLRYKLAAAWSKLFGQQQEQDLQLSEKELRSIIKCSKRMEKLHVRLFDKVLVHRDPDEACRQLTRLVSQLQQEDQWVPASWLQGGSAESDIDFSQP